MDGRPQELTKAGATILGLSLWITALAMVVWMMLWFLTGNFLGSFLSILAALTFLTVWSYEPKFLRRKNESVATGQPAPLES